MKVRTRERFLYNSEILNEIKHSKCTKYFLASVDCMFVSLQLNNSVFDMAH